MEDKDSGAIKEGVNRPTKHIIKLENGSIIRCLPTGQSATGIRGFTIDLLIVDEAAFVGDNIFAAVTPMLLTTGGAIWLVSTPRGRRGYFWDRYTDPSYTVFHKNSEKCMNERPISESWTLAQREGAIAHLESEKKTMTQKQYAQEYLGEFIEDLTRFFSDELIAKICTGQKGREIRGSMYLGVDVARLGEDESAFESVEKVNRDLYVQISNEVTIKTRLTKTIDRIIDLDKVYHYKQIYIDDAGVGSGVFDVLLQTDQTKRKITSINNASRSLDREDKHRIKLLKEDLYNNLLILMEQGKVILLCDDEVILSLKSVQYEYIIKEGVPTKLRIYGRYTHIVEGLIRALWANKDKHLNIWCGRGRL